MLAVWVWASRGRSARLAAHLWIPSPELGRVELLVTGSSSAVGPPESNNQLFCRRPQRCCSITALVSAFAFILTCWLLSTQERRIGSLDAANSRLMTALTQVKERYSLPRLPRLPACNPTKLSITENGEFKNSSC